jgi:hypothetical protein
MVKFYWKNKLLSSLMAVALASGVAFSGNANAIHLAEDGIGQVLLVPLYLAKYGYETKLVVVNTREDIAVKAKVVIRSAVASSELLDFILYLSPGDVWRGRIFTDSDGMVKIYSDDDSMKNDNVPNGSSVQRNGDGSTFASILPVTQALFTQNLGKGDFSTFGHVEVIGVYGVREGNVNLPGGQAVRVFRGMSKFELARIFDTVPRTSLDEVNWPSEASGLSGSIIRSTDPAFIQLMGTVEMVSTQDRIGYRTPALAGAMGDNIPNDLSFWDRLPGNNNLLGSNNVAPFDGLVISNPTFDVSVAAETPIGTNFGEFGTDKILEIEMALAATNLYGTYEDDSKTEPQPGVNRTRIAVTFPTRYRHGEKDDTQNRIVPGNPCYEPTVNVTDQYSPPFRSDGGIEFSVRAFDNHENDTAIRGRVFSGGPIAERGTLVEVNYFIPEWPATKKNADGSLIPGSKNFESGWFDMNLIVRSGCPYSGAPVLSFTHKHKEFTTDVFTQSWFVPNSHKPIFGICADEDGCEVF